MVETKVSLVYRALISSFGAPERRIIDSKKISSIAHALGFDPASIRNALVRGRYILPVYFSGIYYLLDPEEISTKYLRLKCFEIVAGACALRFGRSWYYGLSSSLYLNGMMQQSPRQFIIITDSHLPTNFNFQGTAFRIRKSAARDYMLEIGEKGRIRVSSPARTLTDFLYFYSKEGKQDYAISFARDILNDFPKIREKIDKKLISIYPQPYNMAISYILDEASAGHGKRNRH